MGCRAPWGGAPTERGGRCGPLAEVGEVWQLTQELSKWIKSLRANVLYRRYKLVSRIRTDHAGEWDDDCKEWQEAIASHDTGLGLSVDMDYVSPDMHEQNPAERACGITECVIKAILMQNNLPPYFCNTSGRRLPRTPSSYLIDYPLSRQTLVYHSTQWQ